MFGRKELARLQQQKQALILESELNRLRLRVEWLELRHSFAPLAGAAKAWTRPTRPLLLVGTLLAGWVVSRRWRRAGSVVGGLAGVANWLWPLYRQWRRACRQASPPTDPA